MGNEIRFGSKNVKNWRYFHETIHLMKSSNNNRLHTGKRVPQKRLKYPCIWLKV